MARVVLAGLLGAVLCVAAPGWAEEGGGSDGGVSVRWTFAPGATGDPSGILDVFVSDQRSGAPVRYPAGALLGWLQRERPALVEPSGTCADQVMALATQGIGRRGDADLNGYRIVSVNSDGSVAFINPYVGFNNAKLESIVDLHATPLDWAQDRERMQAWALLANPEKLVAIDLATRAARREVALPAGAGAARIALDAASGTLWVALPGIGRIGSVSLASPAAPLVTDAAPGVAGLLAAADGGVVAWVGADHGLTFVAGPPSSRHLALAAEPVAIRHSANAAATVVATADGGLTLLPDAAEAPERVAAAGHPVRAMELFGGGRFALLAGAGQASVVDLSTLVATARFPVRPTADAIALTERYAYVIDRPSGHASMVPLDDLGRGRAQVLDIIVAAEGGTPGGPGAPARAVADPEGSGLLVASDSDGMISQYSEGMMAPSGSYSNYRRAAVALDIVDYSLREVAAGHYRAVVRAGAGGGYALLLGGIRPRFSACARITLPGDPSPADAAPALRAELVATDHGAGEARVRVRVLEVLPTRASAPVAGLPDVTLLVFDKRSGWQRRVALADVGAGEYEGLVHLPRQGAYELLASSSAANLSFVEGRLGERVLGARP